MQLKNYCPIKKFKNCKYCIILQLIIYKYNIIIDLNVISGSLSQALWHPEMQKAEVIHQVGSCWSSVGHMVDKKLYLFPEEALYLLETVREFVFLCLFVTHNLNIYYLIIYIFQGVLELYYGDIPLSVQRAYSLLLEPVTDLSEDCYRVYSQLTANGYKVLRHNASNILTKYEKQLQIHKAGIKVKKNIPQIKIKDPVTEVDSSERKKQKLESLSETFENIKCVEDETSFLNNLKIFKPYEGNDPSTLQVHYDAYLSSDGNTSFRKSCHQLPKVRIVVHR